MTPASPPLCPGYGQQLLAAIRTRFANECTLLPYVRTSLALIGFGLALLPLAPRRTHGLGLGPLPRRRCCWWASCAAATTPARFEACRR